MTKTAKKTVAPIVKDAPAVRGYYFGDVWKRNVIEGRARDHGKLIEHGVRLGVGQRWYLERLKFDTLLERVGKALKLGA